ncbi:hypothetical protein Peur_072905 [Populus x canadensis]
MSSLFSDDNIFDLLRDERGDIDVAKLVSKAEALAKKKKKEQQRLEKLIAQEKRKEDYFYDNKEIDGKIVAQEKAEPRKEKEKNGAFVKDLEDKRRDLNNKKKVKNHKLDLKEKEEAEISEETKRSDAGNKRPVEKKKLKKGNKKEKEEVEGPAGVVKGLFLVLHEAVTVVVFMALGAMMYSTWKEL